MPLQVSKGGNNKYLKKFLLTLTFLPSWEVFCLWLFGKLCTLGWNSCWYKYRYVQCKINSLSTNYLFLHAETSRLSFNLHYGIYNLEFLKKKRCKDVRISTKSLKIYTADALNFAKIGKLVFQKKSTN